MKRSVQSSWRVVGWLVPLAAACAASQPRAPTSISALAERAVAPQGQAGVHEQRGTPAVLDETRPSFGLGGRKNDLNGIDVSYDVFVGPRLAITEHSDFAAGTIVRPVACSLVFTHQRKVVSTESWLGYFRADANEPDVSTSRVDARSSLSDPNAPEPCSIEFHVQPKTKSWNDVASKRDVEVIIAAKPYVPRTAGPR
ncbi:MAG: hypothetical protein ACKVWV_01030 [Planctomycetota bacterium]